jgi:hypothetical protein
MLGRGPAESRKIGARKTPGYRNRSASDIFIGMVDGIRPPVLEYASRTRRFRSRVWRVLLKDASFILIVSAAVTFIAMIAVVLAIVWLSN